jgi:hypothetical protein
MKQAWCIDFCISGKIIQEPRVQEYDEEALELDMRKENALKVEDLTDWDRIVFSKEGDALDYLERYFEIYDEMPTQQWCQSRELPALPYRTRNLVQTLLGDKLQTRRAFSKPWAKGQRFNLHDRKTFVTVELTAPVIDHGPKAPKDERYEYKFKNL